MNMKIKIGASYKQNSDTFYNQIKKKVPRNHIKEPSFFELYTFIKQ